MVIIGCAVAMGIRGHRFDYLQLGNRAKIGNEIVGLSIVRGH